MPSFSKSKVGSKLFFQFIPLFTLAPIYQVKLWVQNSYLLSNMQISYNIKICGGTLQVQIIILYESQAGLEAAFQVPMPGDSGSSPDASSISNYCLTQEIFTPTPADCCPSISLKQAKSNLVRIGFFIQYFKKS